MRQVKQSLAHFLANVNGNKQIVPEIVTYNSAAKQLQVRVHAFVCVCA
jgi:hypothetical protein